MKSIIKEIQSKLSAVPTLEYIDQDWGQMDFYEPPPVKFPCALIDIQSANFSNNGKLSQHGVAMVVIRLFDTKLSLTAAQEQKENAKKIWQLIEDVNRALHGQNFLSEGFGFPIREEMQKTKRNDGYYQTELFYSIQFTDNSCVPVYGKSAAEPAISVSLLK